MAVTPLANRPVPPNSNFNRAMYVWVTSNASQDPLDTDADQNALLSFCGTQGVNVLFVDIWQYLGGANWTTAKRDRMKTCINAAHLSGIQVYALAGDLGWATNQDWVMKNIINPIMAFNAIAGEAFDGICLDVEYWVDPTTYPASVHCPGLCDLVKAVKHAADLPVGLFSGFYLKDNTATRAGVVYNGKTAQDGEHFMDVADFVVVGSYRNHAADNGTDGPGQDTLFQPWYDYAAGQGRNAGLYVGSETTNVTPTYITYYGKTKAAMETEHATTSGVFKGATNAVFLGQSVHSYDGWKAMT